MELITLGIARGPWTEKEKAWRNISPGYNVAGKLDSFLCMDCGRYSYEPDHRGIIHRFDCKTAELLEFKKENSSKIKRSR